MSEEDATKFAITELLSRLGLTLLPAEALRAALERIDQLGVMEHAEAIAACMAFLEPRRGGAAPGALLPLEAPAGDTW